MHVIYRKIRHARYLYIKRNVEKVWGARYTLGARYLSKNTVYKMQRLEVSGAVRPIYGSLGVKRLIVHSALCMS